MPETTSDGEGLSLATRGDEGYFDDANGTARTRKFDAQLLSEPVTVLSTRLPLIFPKEASTSEAMRSMQAQHRGCVLVSENGTSSSALTGIFTERDIMLRVINRGRNPAETPLSDVMTWDPEALKVDARIAWVLNVMSVGGFRHVPVVNGRGYPVAVISVRDVVEFLVQSFPTEILNLPPDFDQRRALSRDGA